MDELATARLAGLAAHRLEDPLSDFRVSMLPVAAYVLPTRARGFPSIGDPMCAAVLEYEAPRNPRIRMTVPVPVAGRPDVAVARRGSAFLPRRRGCGIRIDAGSGGSESAQRAGVETQRDQYCFAHGVHFPSLLWRG